MFFSSMEAPTKLKPLSMSLVQNWCSMSLVNVNVLSQSLKQEPVVSKRQTFE